MTVSSTTNRMSYTGSGSTATYAYSFKVFDDDELRVKVKLTSTLVETTLTKTTDYTVTGVGIAAGGNVVLVNSSQAWLDGSGFLLSTYTLTIDRVEPITQETSITTQGTNLPENVENSLDRCTMVDQQQQREIDQSLKLPITETGSAAKTTLPNATDRPNRVFAWDSSGNPTTTAITTLATAAPVTSSFVVLAADATLTNERVLTGTATQITVTDGGAGAAVTLSLPSTVALTTLTATTAAFTGVQATNTTILGNIYFTSYGPTISADTDNLATGGACLLRLNNSGAWNITGMVAETSGSNAGLKILLNAGTNTFTLKNQSASSTAANRFLIAGGGDFLLTTGKTVMAIYDTTSLRWRLMTNV